MIENQQLASFGSKEELFDFIRVLLQEKGFEIIREDMERPWGGFFAIKEDQILAFKEMFFAELDLDDAQLKQKLSPKILIVGPHKRLSWQYHHRRSEIWKLVAGEGGIVRSDTDQVGLENDLEIGVLIRLAQGERHRLVGKNSWGIVAEIWMHTDPSNPSNEEDIVRVEDDFSRK
ncbi:hypothetical protein P872_02715 [Rhodonellum psychrophilum GCM71 = DSM 17998]|uniref:Mannose-6-phosphate isomerase type II C-terminal domain-containing protein n=2 Tax=Rhodonellum TaxID=336827 RepID=U5C482_9BACT|nr:MULTISPECIES: hypothetical protein [Rhodonellum]ERM83731.1 hypothetical protein P872_02715 [Rhodonellum psychrophilum GCM71 = DSM 17998]MDO9553150.1 phosphoheptose isomerase [Rhodonellum sp.]